MEIKKTFEMTRITPSVCSEDGWTICANKVFTSQVTGADKPHSSADIRPLIPE